MEYQHHVLEDHLEAYALQQLQAGELDALEDHLLVCDVCRQRLTETEQRLTATRIAARRIREDETQARAKRGSWIRFSVALFSFRPAAVLATAAILGLGLVAVQYRQPEVTYQEVRLTALRGGDPAAAGVAGKALRLRLDLQGLENQGPVDVAVVNADGSPVLRQSVTRKPAEPTLVITLQEKLPAGQYWVRLERAPGQTLREYSLRIR